MEGRVAGLGSVERATSGSAEVEAEAEPKASLPPFCPFSPSSGESGGDARLKVRLARIQMEAQERAETRQAEMKLRLEVRRLEIEADKELESKKFASDRSVQPNPVISRAVLVNPANSVSDVAAGTFDISKHIALVPHFRESEVDTYFAAFERVAAALHWPKEYDVLKVAVLRAYELVPEAYRQRFRNHKKVTQQTFIIAEEKEIDVGFKPFLMKGLVSINGKSEEQKEIQILRDTGAVQSFLVSDVLPLSEQTLCGSSVLVQGIEMGVVKKDVSRYCRTCHECQLMGKPNQKIPPAPLVPVPVICEPFEHVILDCVGPLPKSKAEAIPLRKITAPVIIKALLKFFSTFGLPKIVQTDQGTNFLSNVFRQVLKTLGITHRTSTPYHPESQGAIERFHQTFKSMLRKNGTKDPAELVFGHTLRGPLKVLKDGMLNETKLDMKKRYDKKAVVRKIQPGDDVLVLLPVPGSVLTARFSGPYKVSKKLYCSRNTEKISKEKGKSAVVSSDVLAVAVTAVPDSTVLNSEVLLPFQGEYDTEDGVTFRNDLSTCGRLSNSEVLKCLPETLDNLSESQKQDVVRLIQEFPMLFRDVPTQTHVLQHDIQVTCGAAIKQHAYRVNSIKRSVMKDEVDYLLKNNLAEPSYSPWSSPCLLVPKPDGTYRFCTDYRKVNSVTVPDSYPLPRMEDCIDNLGSAKFVTKLDLLKGYWQVPLTARAAEISAFVTSDNFLQYRVMAFGLRNAPATFQRLVNIVLSGVQNCNAYLDDLVIYSSSWSEHLAVLRTVFERLADASLTVNLAKCDFGKATITYLGKQVGQGHVRPVSAKVSAIVEFPVPTIRRELRRFLGMSGYYRCFCRNFSTVVYPLTSLLSPASAFVWTEACQHAFESVKLLLTNVPVLAAPDFTRSFKLEVDASAVGMGAILIQEDDVGLEHPVCYFSRKFNRHQRNYSTIEKEALGWHYNSLTFI
ncbi:hypothetical protein M9458_052948 [Cirrhinus mrigala]|uniref:ribonuclease H n=1 Tax=Cirrhinus mrigala TaxID=683832 RepID=A0ABD0MSG8_CIRMR